MTARPLMPPVLRPDGYEFVCPTCARRIGLYATRFGAYLGQAIHRHRKHRPRPATIPNPAPTVRR